MTDTTAKLRALYSSSVVLLRATEKALTQSEQKLEAALTNLDRAMHMIEAKNSLIKRQQIVIQELNMKEWEQQDKDEKWWADYIQREEERTSAQTTLMAQHMQSEDEKVVDDIPF